MLIWLPVKPRIEKTAGAPGASPPCTPTAAWATSEVGPISRSLMVCWSITSTVAGVSRAVSPKPGSRLSATALVLSGVWVTSPPPEAGAGSGTAVCVRARPATRPARAAFAALRTRFDAPACAVAARRRQARDCQAFSRPAARPAPCTGAVGARSKESKQAERRDRRTQPALDRNAVASIGVALTGMLTRTRMAWRKMTMIYEFDTYRSTAKHLPVSAVAVVILPSPQAADTPATLATSEHPARRVRA